MEMNPERRRQLFQTWLLEAGSWLPPLVGCVAKGRLPPLSNLVSLAVKWE